MASLEQTVESLEAEGRLRAAEWSAHKAELQAQADHLLGLLKERDGVTATHEKLQEQVRSKSLALEMQTRPHSTRRTQVTPPTHTLRAS